MADVESNVRVGIPTRIVGVARNKKTQMCENLVTTNMQNPIFNSSYEIVGIDDYTSNMTVPILSSNEK